MVNVAVVSYKSHIDPDKIPLHISIIMDGNGRWAKKHNKPRVFGHRNGVRAVREVTEGAAELGIKYLTLYAFSQENWKRPITEVTTLMKLFVQTLGKELDSLNKNNIRLRAIGDLEHLPVETYNALMSGIESTRSNDHMDLILAINYSSRWEITEAVKEIVEEAESSGRKPESIDPAYIQSFLQTAEYPDPELMIRTSGEHRISNFLLWQLSYAELYFTDVLWPDFTREDLYEAIVAYQNRERRFGLTGEQLMNS